MSDKEGIAFARGFLAAVGLLLLMVGLAVAWVGTSWWILAGGVLMVIGAWLLVAIGRATGSIR